MQENATPAKVHVEGDCGDTVPYFYRHAKGGPECTGAAFDYTVIEGLLNQTPAELMR